MAHFLTFILLFIFTSTSCAQDIVIDSCGLDNNPTLNPFEIAYFDEGLKYWKPNDFNFEQKKILFLRGNYGAMTNSKSDFFEHSGKPRYANNDFPSIQLIVLSQEEKTAFPNCDAIIISWSKIPVSKRNRKKFLKNALNATA